MQILVAGHAPRVGPHSEPRPFSVLHTANAPLDVETVLQTLKASAL